MFNTPINQMSNLKFKTDASTYAEHLDMRIQEIALSLTDDERIGITIPSLGQSNLQLINIQAKDTSFVIFECVDSKNNNHYFIQSTQQINIVISKIKVIDKSSAKTIGFIK